MVMADLLLAQRGATDEQLWEALDVVDAGEWARSLADGLDTEVGSGGVRVGHRIIEINGQSVVAVPHERIVGLCRVTEASADVGEEATIVNEAEPEDMAPGDDEEVDEVEDDGGDETPES